MSTNYLGDSITLVPENWSPMPLLTWIGRRFVMVSSKGTLQQISNEDLFIPKKLFLAI